MGKPGRCPPLKQELSGSCIEDLCPPYFLKGSLRVPSSFLTEVANLWILRPHPERSHEGSFEKPCLSLTQPPSAGEFGAPPM